MLQTQIKELTIVCASQTWRSEGFWQKQRQYGPIEFVTILNFCFTKTSRSQNLLYTRWWRQRKWSGGWASLAVYLDHRAACLTACQQVSGKYRIRTVRNCVNRNGLSELLEIAAMRSWRLPGMKTTRSRKRERVMSNDYDLGTLRQIILYSMVLQILAETWRTLKICGCVHGLISCQSIAWLFCPLKTESHCVNCPGLPL